MFSVLFRRCLENLLGGEGVRALGAEDVETNRFCKVEDEEDDKGPFESSPVVESVCRCKRSGEASIRSTAAVQCNGEEGPRVLNIVCDSVGLNLNGPSNGETKDVFGSIFDSVAVSAAAAVAAVVAIDEECDCAGDRNGDVVVAGDTFRGCPMGVNSD